MAEDSSISVVIDPNPSDSISKRSSSRFVSLSLVPKDFTSTKNNKPAAVGSEPSDTSSERECYSGDVSPHSCDFETFEKIGPISYTKLSFNDVQKQINKYYEQDTVHRYSSALDILASYLKGQKIIYMEARSHTVFLLNCLMLASIGLTAIASVSQEPLINLKMDLLF